MSDELTYAEAMCQMGALEDKINGLADEFDAMGDEHDALTWYVAEMQSAMPKIIGALQALTMAVDALAKKAGATIGLAPELFVPPNRAQRRQAARNGHAGSEQGWLGNAVATRQENPDQ